MPDKTDLDDDNDGILDTDEGCIYNTTHTNVTPNSNGEYRIFVFTDGLVDSLPNDDGYIPGTMTFVANNLQTGSLTIEDNDDYLHDNYSGDGQITDSNGEQYIAGTTTYIASISRSAVTNNTTGESGSVYTIKKYDEPNKFYFAPTIEINNEIL